jgi:hypothetical protein
MGKMASQRMNSTTAIPSGESKTAGVVMSAFGALRRFAAMQ